MAPRCCVANCDDKAFAKHHFPNPKMHEDLLREWVARVNNPKLSTLAPSDIYRKYHVCDKHFTAECRIPNSKCLKKRALPSLFLPDCSGKDLSSFLPYPDTNKDNSTTSVQTVDVQVEPPPTQISCPAVEDPIVRIMGGVCSICSYRSQCQNVFDLRYNKRKLVDLFYYCTKIKIARTENPFYMCYTCLAKLTNAYDFIKQSRKAWQCYKLAANRCCQQPKQIILGNKENAALNNQKLNVVGNNNLDSGKEEDTVHFNDNDLGIEPVEVIVNDLNEESNMIDLGKELCNKNVEDNQIKTPENILSKKRQVCNLCKKAFSNTKSLRRHLWAHKNKHRLVCYICGKGFPSRDALKLHACIHLGIKPYLCRTCGKRFTQLQQLQTHLRIHAGEKPYSCKHCSKSFRTSGNLGCHIRERHTKKKPRIYNICEKSYIRKPQEEKHLKTNKSVSSNLTNRLVKVFSCKLCPETFDTEAKLKKHKCPKPQPYVCDTCGKGFIRKNHLALHERSHKRKSPYVCYVCSKEFKSQSILTVHMYKHRNERMYVCEICSETFLKQKQLITHRRVHADEKQFDCEVCLKSFSMKKTLMLHLETHGEEASYVCCLCDAGFYTSTALKKHKTKCITF